MTNQIEGRNIGEKVREARSHSIKGMLLQRATRGPFCIPLGPEGESVPIIFTKPATNPRNGSTFVIVDPISGCWGGHIANGRLSPGTPTADQLAQDELQISLAETLEGAAVNDTRLSGAIKYVPDKYGLRITIQGVTFHKFGRGANCSIVRPTEKIVEKALQASLSFGKTVLTGEVLKDEVRVMRFISDTLDRGLDDKS